MHSSVRKFVLLGSILAVSLARATAAPNTRTLASDRSAFGEVSVTEAGGMRFLNIEGTEQSAINLQDKRAWVHSYTYLLSLGILTHGATANDAKARVLVIGLGGGVFANFVAESFPNWQVDVVEINPAVIRLAKKYFPIAESVQIFEADARRYLRETDTKYDIIVMDAFDDRYIPMQLYTIEYFSLMQKRLQPQGLVLMNAWEDNPLELQEISTLLAVFKQGYWINNPKETPGNRIYILSETLPRMQTVKTAIASRFTAHHFPGENPQRFLGSMRDLKRYRRVAAITDETVDALFKKYRRAEK